MSAAGAAPAKIWRDGVLVDWADANIHIMSHVVHYGSGVFEGVRAYETPGGSAIFRLHDHMRRLRDSARIYRLNLKYSVDELAQACIDTAAASGLRACYIRPLVIRTGERLNVVSPDSPIETFVIARPWGVYLGEEGFLNGVDVCVSSWRRNAPSTVPALAKASGHYLSSQLAKAEALNDGYAEAIMLDTAGLIAEGSGENLFLVKDGVLLTSPVASSILNGITRDSVVTLAREMGIEVRVMALPRELMHVADEMFFCGTAVEITPIRSVDRIAVGEGKPGPVTKALQEQFMGIAQGQLPDRHNWLTAVPQTAAV